MSTKDDALIEAMIDAYEHNRPYKCASYHGMRAALIVARKAILEEAASMVENTYSNDCFECRIADGIRLLADKDQSNG